MEEEEAKKREREREIRQLTRTKGTERVGTGADKKEHSNKKRKKNNGGENAHLQLISDYQSSQGELCAWESTTRGITKAETQNSQQTAGQQSRQFGIFKKKKKTKPHNKVLAFCLVLFNLQQGLLSNQCRFQNCPPKCPYTTYNKTELKTHSLAFTRGPSHYIHHPQLCPTLEGPAPRGRGDF